MNVLFLSEPSYPRHPGGAGKGTHILAAGLAARGHTVRILCQCREETTREVIDGVEVHRVNWEELDHSNKQTREAAIAAKLLDYASREIPLPSLDLVYDSGGFLSFFFPVAYQLRVQHRLPVIVHYRYLMARHHASLADTEFDAFALGVLGLEAAINEPSQSFPARFADAVVCPSSADARFIHASFLPASGAPAVLPEPADTDLADLKAAARLRAELAGPGGQLVYFGGRIDSDMKGGDLVIDAMARMLAVRPRVRLVLPIKGPDGLDPFRKRLGPAAIGLPWMKDASELATVLAAVDLALMPSLYESFGMMCVESLAAGTPVVASQTGALPDLIQHGENGFLLQARDRSAWPAEMAELGLRVLGDPALSRRLSDAALESARRYSTDRIAEQAEAICLSVLERVRRQGPMELRAPPLSETDRARYLDLLESMVGPEARAAGERAIADWGAAIVERCTACSRQNLAGSARDLVALGKRSPPRRLWDWATGAWPGRMEAAVAAACPWGLLQKELIRRAQKTAIP
ncbi:MAG TPA: glycosyltransferase family 4 protein [Myxococcaceae bacterium]